MIPPLMIGIMKCRMDSIDCGSVRSASIAVKPKYREHQTSYPQLTDTRVLSYVENVCKVEGEEAVLLPLVKSITLGLIRGLPYAVPFDCSAPGVGGTAIRLTGEGFGSAAGLSAKANEFGSLTVESTGMEMVTTPYDITLDDAGLPIGVPYPSAQALTLSMDNLIYGEPTVNGDPCNAAQFQASCKVRYLCLSWPPVIDAGILESTDFSISCEAMYSTAGLLTAAQANMTPGTSLVAVPCKMQVNTVGGDTCSVELDGVVEADLSFSPGNDWNGLSLRISTLLNDPSKIGTNWANFS